MKTKAFILLLFFFLPLISYCQVKTRTFEGSWMGIVSAKDFKLRALFKFEGTDDNLQAVFDSPDQELKDLPIDKVWIANDSLFVDASRSLNAGIIFKGKILPGDSVIDGVWGGALGLKLRRTNFVFTIRINQNPAHEGYKIKKLIKSTPIKDQQVTNVCWSYATTSFFETEAIRLGKKEVVLAPMFYLLPTYKDKAEKYIRMKGKSYFAQGDLTFSALKAYKNYGAVPENIWCGKKDTLTRHNHNSMFNTLQDKVNFYVQSGHGAMTSEGYRNDIDSIVSRVMGKAPEHFVYAGKNFTPKSFADEMIGINPDDYIEVTSFSHHPFYSKFILEIESNWNNNYYLNIPIDDLGKLVDYALMHNYSVCWDGDAYNEDGFKASFANLPDSITDITQKMRQTAFDNYTTSDVHNMHIIGIAQDRNGKEFYILKNSYDAKKCGGYMYMSKEYFLLKTISVMVNKNAFPEELKGRTGKVL